MACRPVGNRSILFPLWITVTLPFCKTSAMTDGRIRKAHYRLHHRLIAGPAGRLEPLLELPAEGRFLAPGRSRKASAPHSSAILGSRDEFGAPKNCENSFAAVPSRSGLSGSKTPATFSMGISVIWRCPFANILVDARMEGVPAGFRYSFNQLA